MCNWPRSGSPDVSPFDKLDAIKATGNDRIFTLRQAKSPSTDMKGPPNFSVGYQVTLPVGSHGFCVKLRDHRGNQVPSSGAPKGFSHHTNMFICIYCVYIYIYIYSHV